MYRQLLNPLKTKCQICKTDIVKDQSNRKYCSDCAKKREHALKVKWMKEHYIKRFTTKICPLCSTVFNTGKGGKIYCKKSCQKIAQRITVLEKQILKNQKEIRRLRTGDYKRIYKTKNKDKQ